MTRSFVEGWVAEYARAPQGELLDRCCDLAQALDPAAGITRVHQLLLASGSGDEEAHSTLRAEAAGQNASLCPNCFALVPIPVAPEPARVIVGPGRVEGEGYHVDLSDHGLLTRLAVDAPAGPIYRGPEPGRSLTRRGAVLLVVLPLAILAGFAAVMPTVFAIPPVAPVAALLLVATLIYAATRVLIDDRGDLAGRAIDRAWAILVPPLIRADPRPGPARFIAGLAEASVGRGQADMRQDVLVRAVEVFENSRTVQSFVTPLHALQIEDDRRAGGDDLSALADRAAASFEGRLPLDHAEILIDRLRGDSADRTRRARLRVLLLTRAFLTGLEPEDLRVLGRLYPHLGSAYASEDRNGLARLRLLWLYRSRRLWQRVGSATSVFDLARYPTLTDLYLRRRPDLLLLQPSGDTDVTTDPILICEEGVVFRDSIVREGDADIRVRAKPAGKGGGFELQMGDEKYAFGDDPAVLARRLQEWARFLFQEFLPRARLLGMRRSARGDRLIAQKSAICPACLRQFLALRGEVGLTAPLNADEDDE